MASCASIAAARGGNEWEALTNGLPQNRLLRQRAAQRHGGRLRSIRAASTSAPPAGRCTPRPIPATTGRPSSTICRRCCRWKSRPCHDPRRAAHTSAAAGEDRAGGRAPGRRRPRPSTRCWMRWRARIPVLRGTIRDHVTKERRAFIRFFACGEDWSHEPPDMPLPEAVVKGEEPLRIVGAMAGG